MQGGFPFQRNAALPDPRPRDGAHGDALRECLDRTGNEDVLAAPRTPWRNLYVERLIGSIRRDYLDHGIVFDEARLQRVLSHHFDNSGTIF